MANIHMKEHPRNLHDRVTIITRIGSKMADQAAVLSRQDLFHPIRHQRKLVDSRLYHTVKSAMYKVGWCDSHRDEIIRLRHGRTFT